EGDSTGYRLAPESAEVDVLAAEQLVGTAEQEARSGRFAYAAGAAGRAGGGLGLGTPLAGEAEGPWGGGTRPDVPPFVRRARAVRWESALELRDFGAAIDAATATLTADPLDEAAGRALMRAYSGVGERAAALRVYDTLRAALADELGTDPSDQTRTLFTTLL